MYGYTYSRPTSTHHKVIGSIRRLESLFFPAVFLDIDIYVVAYTVCVGVYIIVYLYVDASIRIVVRTFCSEWE